MTHAELTFLAIGLILGVVGATVVSVVRSVCYERWAEPDKQAECTVTSPRYDWTKHDDWAGELAEHTEQAHRRLSSVARVVPIQRGAVD